MAEIDRAREALFLAKADLPLPDGVLAALPGTSDADLGISPAVLREALAAFGLGAEVKIHRAAVQGTFHRLYDVLDPGGGARILRVSVFRGAADAQHMAMECRLARILLHAGLPVCACEYRRLGEGVQALGLHLQERAQGPSLAMIEGDEPAIQAALGRVGHFLATLHGITGHGYGPLSFEGLAAEPPRLAGLHTSWEYFVGLKLDDHLAHCVAQGALSEAESRAARGHFGARRESLHARPAALLHGDPGSQNVIVGPEGIRAVIDWEDALLGDPLFDLASLCTFQPERRHAAILAGYGLHLDADDDTRDRFWLYFLRIALAKTVHRRRFGHVDRPGLQPASRRIQLALARLDGER